MSDVPTVDPRRARAPGAQIASSPAPESVPAPSEASVAAVEVSEPAPEPPAAPEDSASDLPSTEPSSATIDLPVSTEAPADQPAPPSTGSQELDAAITATLAMETETASSAGQERVEDAPPATTTGGAAAAAVLAREETSTPTLYEAAASSADVPTKVDTPQLAAPAANRPAAPKAKATSSLSRVAQLTARVEKDPLDGEAQLALLHDAEQKGDLERTREVYEKFLAVFPDAAQQWIAYCDLELSHNLFDRVEAIFARCLRISTSVDLWRFYLDYIRRINPIDPTNIDAAKQTRSIIATAFEFALAHVGQDRRAGEIWSEFIAFLREGPTRGTWEDQQKMDALRKAYQRAVQVPLNNVEAIWQEYNAFENNLSKMTAKKFIAELSPSYMTARKTLRELRAQHDALYTPVLPHRPDWDSAEDRTALEGWKRYLAYEESNPLEIDDPGALQQRVGFAYRKALANLRFYAEIWYLSAHYNLRVGKFDEARGQLRAGLTAIPSSLLLAFTLADIEESKQDFTACYAIYDSLIEHLYGRIAQLEATVEEEMKEAVEELETQNEEDKTEEEDNVETREKKAEDVENAKKAVREKRQPEIDSLKRMAANVWITEMRFARRSDGVKPARAVFTKARKSPHLVWQVVEASATMEMYWNSEPKVATNVFELGLKMFAKEPDYVLRYLDFLLQQNNANNARALFERTVALIEPAQAKPIWDRMAQYEWEYGDHLATQKMFQRYSETFPDVPAPVRFARKHAYHGLEDAFAQDLGPEVCISRGRSRSPSPRRARTKRNLSAGPEASAQNGAAVEDGDYGSKRPRRGPSPSPAPSSQGGSAAWGAGRPPMPAGDDFGRRSTPQAAPALNRAVPFMLDPRGDNVAVLPDAVVFFLSLLPSASAFTGPQLNPVTIMDIIGTTILPGSAPGPGLPGERLGIPPRPKPERAGYGGGLRRPLSPQRAPPGGGGVPGGAGGGDYGYNRRRY
ncbi:hypothetical protein JCM1840_007513 [Sporobolomyces johnsonii]